MRRYGNLLIVIADGEHARMVRPSPANVLHTVQQFDSLAAHKQSSELRSDHPGASYHSDSTAHHAMTPRHDPHELEKEKFSRFVAHELNALSGNDFDGLVIAAPAHSLNLILHSLHSMTREKLIGTLAKDLIKTPDAELSQQLKAFLPPPSPARNL